MRILFVSNLYPPMHLGGMELRCEEVVRGMTERGHTCMVLTSNFSRPGELPASDAGIRRKLHLEADVYHYKPFDYLLRHPRRTQENTAIINGAIAAFRPDLVFFWGMWNFSPALLAAAHAALPGHVANSFAGFWPLEPDSHEQYWRANDGNAASRGFRRILSPLALSRIYRRTQWGDTRFDHAVFCSHFMLEYFRAHGFQCPHTQVVFSGIDTELFRPSGRVPTRREPGQLRILFAGGYTPHKGAHTVVEAVRRLVDQGMQGIHLTLMGSGAEGSRAQLAQQIAQAHLDPIITLRGAIARAEMPSVMHEHDALVLATLSNDPLPRIVMEAMACGLVTLASNRAGPLEMISHEVDGLLFHPEDSWELSELLRRVALEPEWSEHLAIAARKTAETRFTLERMVSEMEAFLVASLSR